MKVNYIFLKDSVVINHNANTHTVHRSDECYVQVKNAIKSKDYDELLRVVDKSAAIENYVPDGEFVVLNGAIYSNGERVNGYIENKLLEFVEEGLPYEYLLNFWKRLRENPSANSREQLYPFLERAKCPITARGTFIAYKAVKRVGERFFAYHGYHNEKTRFEYIIGEPAAEDRSTVIDNPNQACGSGVHVGSYAYASSFNSGDDKVILEVEVDPADVVSVPKDCDYGKCRCCLVVPVAVLTGGEYNKSIVVEDEGHESDAVISHDTVTINRKEYTRVAVSETEVEEISIKRSTVRLLQAPRVIHSLYTVSKCYVVESYFGPVYYVVSENENVPEYIKFSPVLDTQDAQDTQDSQDSQGTQDTQDSLMFKGQSIQVIEISEEEYTRLKKVATKVRASKYPAFARSLNFSEVYRCMSGISVKFFGVVDGRYYKVV